MDHKYKIWTLDLLGSFNENVLNSNTNVTIFGASQTYNRRFWYLSHPIINYRIIINILYIVKLSIVSMKIANISFYFIETCSKYISNCHMHVKYFYLQIGFFILVYFNFLRISVIRVLIDYRYIL